MTIKNLLNKSIEKDGADYKLNLCQEECAELIQAISKIKRYGNTEELNSHLAEEIGDVQICIYYLQKICNIPDSKINAWKKKKILRIYSLLRK